MVFEGLSAFPITPADQQGRIDTDGLRVLVRRLVAAGVDSIGLLGSTGTSPFFTRAERLRAVEAAVDEVAGRVPVLVGIGALRTEDVIRLAQDAKAAGADAALLAPVSYTPLTEHEVFTHCVAVAEAVDLPVCLYNNPSTTHFTFSDDLIARLSQVPRIRAVKHPGAVPSTVTAQLRHLVGNVPHDFSIGYSGDWFATEALLAGGRAWYSVAAGLFPEPCVAIVRAVQGGQAAEARRLDERLTPLWTLFKELSSLRVIYAAANHMDLCRAQPPRPVLPLAAADQARVIRTLAELDLV